MNAKFNRITCSTLDRAIGSDDILNDKKEATRLYALATNFPLPKALPRFSKPANPITHKLPIAISHLHKLI